MSRWLRRKEGIVVAVAVAAAKAATAAVRVNIETVKKKRPQRERRRHKCCHTRGTEKDEPAPLPDLLLRKRNKDKY